MLFLDQVGFHAHRKKENTMADGRKDTSPENGKLGGVKSDEGKAQSSQNARKHGLYAQKSPVLSTESQACYDRFHDDMVRCHQPRGRQEIEIVEQLIENTWRMDRYQAAQECILEIEMSNQADELAAKYPNLSLDTRMTLALHACLKAKSGAFREHSRLIQRLQRTQQRLLAELRDLQGPRFNAAAKSDPKPDEKSENEPNPVENPTEPAAPVCRTPAQSTIWVPSAPPIVLPDPEDRHQSPPEKTMVA